MTNGLTCGRPDGHPGKHRSPGALKRKWARQRIGGPDHARKLQRERERRADPKYREHVNARMRAWKANAVDYRDRHRFLMLQSRRLKAIKRDRELIAELEAILDGTQV